jgi:hypothetical protein
MMGDIAVIVFKEDPNH